MIKRTVTYVNYNGADVSTDLYFHISKMELADHLELKDEMTSIQQMLAGGNRQLTTEETKRLVSMLKTFIRLGYGKKSPDGEQFRKSDAIWEEFVYSPAYDALMWSIIKNPEDCWDFISKMMPADLLEEARAQAGQSQLDFDGKTPTIPTPTVQEKNAFGQEPAAAVFDKDEQRRLLEEQLRQLNQS